ncbi:hypothetical protein [Microcoleus vaginatus]|uniref:hypothetical protein n=1 Tax=Microcoleus vaginatus TaxID=119532 RepID=UPI001F60E093|nr:hypothetical protein D0A37_08465 [Microcoleus vaginatus HSN003]
MQTLGFKIALSARFVYNCTTKVVDRGVISAHASDSPDRVIYGNHSIVRHRSAFLGNKLKTKGKKMQKTEFFLNSAF